MKYRIVRELTVKFSRLLLRVNCMRYQECKLRSIKQEADAMYPR